MQKVLSLRVENKKIISKPWCFEAFCIMSDKKYEKENEFEAYMEAAAYLFLQTPVTDDILKNLPTADIKNIIDNIGAWYLDDLMQISKMNSIKADSENAKKDSDIRDIYISFFKIYKILPSELAKQPPLFVFSLLGSADEKDITPVDLPPDLQALYGM